MVQTSLRGVIIVLLATLGTVAALDAAVQLFSPRQTLMEAQDGLAALERGNPETVVIGSSHARTLHALGQELAAEMPSAPPLVAIPLEGGKLTGYAWMAEHRIFPLLDEGRADGRLRRDRVRRVIVLTEWWDSCPPDDGLAPSNLPSRVWTWSDYRDDVFAHGFTTFNRNFLREQVRRWFGWSVFVQRRGTGRILLDAARALAGRESIHTPTLRAALVQRWLHMVEGGAGCIGDAAQMQALDAVVDGVLARRLDAVVVLFPRNPDTFSDLARANTLEPFAALVRSRLSSRGVPVIDLTSRTPLTGHDFMDDLDHVSPGGNRVFARWALAHDLAFLKEPVRGTSAQMPLRAHVTP